MPYIKQEKRNELDQIIDQLVAVLNTMNTNIPNSMKGNLNYVFYRVLRMVYDNPNFDLMSDAVSVLEMTKAEYLRKVVAPYEDQKEYDNGKVVIFKDK